MGSYGPIEMAFASPFADGLRDSAVFRKWVIGKTPFKAHARTAVLLHEEMQAKRGAATWWRSHYQERCRCEGCSGQETDILAIFSDGATRFAIHVEVKHPGDKFSNDQQAPSYPIRAACWAGAGRNPARVIPHDFASTMLLFSENCRTVFAPHLPHFSSLITFEEVQASFPEMYA